MSYTNNHIVKTNRKEKFWFHNIRGINYFCYRYWWLVLSVFLLYIFLWYWFCLRIPAFTDCSANQVFSQRVDQISHNVDSCCNCNTPNNYGSNISDIDRLRDSLGGKKGIITVTLRWRNGDDLDLHLVEPNQNTIDYRNRISSTGGALDIDMNAGHVNDNINPIENIYYTSSPPHGLYRIYVNLFASRSRSSQNPFLVYVKVGNEEKVINLSTQHKGDMQKVYEFIY